MFHGPLKRDPLIGLISAVVRTSFISLSLTIPAVSGLKDSSDGEVLLLLLDFTALP